MLGVRSVPLYSDNNWKKIGTIYDRYTLPGDDRRPEEIILEEATEAFKRLAWNFHPDRNHGHNQGYMSEVTAAFQFIEKVMNDRLSNKIPIYKLKRKD